MEIRDKIIVFSLNFLKFVLFAPRKTGNDKGSSITSKHYSSKYSYTAGRQKVCVLQFHCELTGSWLFYLDKNSINKINNIIYSDYNQYKIHSDH